MRENDSDDGLLTKHTLYGEHLCNINKFKYIVVKLTGTGTSKKVILTTNQINL